MNRDVCEHFNPVDLTCDKCRSANVQKSTLREAAQQALEALERLYNDTEIMVTQDQHRAMKGAITALRAALAEPVQEPDPGEYHGWVLREVLFEKGEPVGHREPMQEPAAIVGTQADTWKGYEGQWLPPGPPIKTVHMLRELPEGTLLYTAPPQRKPLTEEEIDSIWDSEKAFADIYAIARAIERAHGITS